MPNIMINKVCNLKCPYCFANEYVNCNNVDNPSNMTLDDFKKAIEFSLYNNPNPRIGIIGGEPTLHPRFSEFMELLICDSRIDNVILFTNGVNLKKYANYLANPKMHVLINLNSPNDIGYSAFNKTIESIDYLVNDLYLKEKVSVGINMYKKDFDYDYMIETLNRFDIKRVRTSISVPNTDDLRSNSPFEYFLEMKPRVMEFFNECLVNDIIPRFDCNLLPTCLIDDNDRELLEKLSSKDSKSNLLCGPTCEPIIDILPNLKAVRCFGCSSENDELDINDFTCIKDLFFSFKRLMDNKLSNEVSDNLCSSCYKHKTMQCTGGCLAFKKSKIEFLRNSN